MGKIIGLTFKPEETKKPEAEKPEETKKPKAEKPEAE